MLIWQGWGILALIIPPITAGLLESLLHNILGMNRVSLFGEIGLTPAVGALLGAGILWFGGRWLNNRPGKRLLDPESGETVEIKGCHTLFWIPMQYWAFIWPLGALAIALLE
ncbi:MAG: hypothetical protein LBR88_10380 [Zoogloeaceae bacterium]|jgi:hypothetical protein|nr:hypothetical protein [Zoogloeaceae bacterium]